ncbi:DUF805 domain-containing protein [Streptomyces sp. ASQP_92]|uniref:DUF805 domain-containing protein n=1 Tax=Streptomyces sp. ASQP_92 TaxID=2979116 RepID=UPI0021C19806|nr:DUF805 domain-containing protein [Streptomyces sp. ASQP_92]MCT9089672.1 DUF805 domain-containing protein [Streptomyces sp. ASQP_92]
MHYYTDALKRYAVFRGRATRAEYWMFWLIDSAIVIAFIAAEQFLGISYIPCYIYVFATVLPTWAVTVRRLHDSGRSGWTILVGLIPGIGGIALLLLCASASSTDESYGPYPGTANPLPAL